MSAMTSYFVQGVVPRMVRCALPGSSCKSAKPWPIARTEMPDPPVTFSVLIQQLARMRLPQYCSGWRSLRSHAHHSPEMDLVDEIDNVGWPLRGVFGSGATV